MCIGCVLNTRTLITYTMNVPSKRIDITLDPKIIDKLDKLIEEYGSSSSRSAMIAMLIIEKYNKEHQGKVK